MYLTGAEPIRVDASGPQDLRLAFDVSAFDQLDVQLRVLALEGTAPTLDITIETGMQLDSSHGWLTIAGFATIASAPTVRVRRLRGLLRYVRYNVTALGGSAPAATFLIDGIARRWAGDGAGKETSCCEPTHDELAALRHWIWSIPVPSERALGHEGTRELVRLQRKMAGQLIGRLMSSVPSATEAAERD